MQESRVAAILLAAGFSRRMSGRNKLLLPWNCQTLIRSVAEQLVGSDAFHVVVVLGHQAMQVREALKGITYAEKINPNPSDGMGSSIKFGIQSLPAEAVATLIVLGDMPMVRKEHFNAIIKATENAPNRIVVPRHNDITGNPVCFGRDYFPDLLRLEGDRGAKSIVAENQDKVRFVEFESASLFEDIDHESDLCVD